MASPSPPSDAPGHGRDAHERERKRMLGATAVFAVATFVSRIAGTVRTVAVAAIFGATTQLSAFTVAFQIPNLIRALVADAALSAAFVPVFTELRERGEAERAWRVAGAMVSLILVVLGPLTVLSMVLAPQIVGIFVNERSFGADNVRLAIDLARIMMPIIVLMALNGLVVGILNAHDHFSVPAIAPVAWNAVILLALVGVAPFLAEDLRIFAYAIGVLSGTVVQVVMPLPWLRGCGGRLRPSRAWGDPKVREILLLMLPVTISLGLINLQQMVDIAFSTHVPGHLFPRGVEIGAGPAILESAFRIYMLPQGMFSVAVSTVLFPALARHAARRDHAAFRDTFADGMRQIFLLLVPSAALMVVLADPLVRLLYEHGAFTAAQTEAVAGAVLGFSLGLVFNGAGLLLIRSFFSLKSPWTPTLVSVLTLVVNAIADWLLYRRYGTTGIAAATSIVNVVAFGAMYVLLRRRVGALGTRRTLRHVTLTVAASAAAAWLALACWRLLDDVLGRGLAGQVTSLGAAGLLAVALYLAAIIRLRLVSAGALRALVTRRKDTAT